jgi:hypothetical protein
LVLISGTIRPPSYTVQKSINLLWPTDAFTYRGANFSVSLSEAVRGEFGDAALSKSDQAIRKKQKSRATADAKRLKLKRMTPEEYLKWCKTQADYHREWCKRKADEFQVAKPYHKQLVKDGKKPPKVCHGLTQ